MNEGQMIMRLPLGASPASPMAAFSKGVPAPVGGANESDFSGVLRGSLPDTSNELPQSHAGLTAVSPEPPETAGIDLFMLQVDSLSAAMATLSAKETEGGPATSSALRDDAEPLKPTEQQQELNPQNVALSAAALQMVAVQQSNGRMPESATTSTSAENVAVQTTRTAETYQALQSLSLTDGGTSAAPTNDLQQNNVAPALQPAPQQPMTHPSTSTPVPLRTTDQPALHNSSYEGLISLADEAVVPETESNMAVTSVQTPSAVVSRQSEATYSRGLVQPVLDAYLQPSPTSSRNSGVNSIAETQTMEETGTETVQTVLMRRTPAAVLHPVVPQAQEDVASSQTDLAEAVDGTASRNETVARAALTKTTSSESGASTGEEGSSTFRQQLEMHPHVTQIKTEQTHATADSSDTSGNATIHTDVMDQVTGQIREHLAGRDIKGGAEQIVIRLSPDNLGELKLNLRMENQCLKIEIVAENSMVRDTLIKHSDTLKESLANQNITMETFDVSTGSNRNGAPSYGQGQTDWQGLARQRQQQAALHSSGGYHQSDTPVFPNKAVYLASEEHSMLDVHF
ncbi:flagellar hook-length control protein FliK [Pelobacter propionicus]|uniref:Flagellar hook-length control protein n=1 Tax=Pelobacter propionicus (strain DSM 2379 / NBRC 103807 / OttBd1) TaxID=338966 RepID=A1AUK4_PELPD|nr:flagellar hook-length control protein FliK [Pelobacter propionicus]ABL01025.1 flagellar hook-length control protein [Pelobacter propionicus DSM 2379]